MTGRPLSRAVGTALALVLVTAGAGSASAGTSMTLGPDAVGWWSAGNVHPALPPVVTPDVGPRDLYVAGARALPSAAGPSGPVAIAALAFRLPEGATVDALELHLSGTRPPAVTLTACRALRPFTSAYAGAWADAPTYDCTDAGTAQLAADGMVLIEGVERLRRGRDLAVVLVPGPLDRVVVAAPDDQALAVTLPRGAPAARGPQFTASTPESVPAPAPAPGFAAAGPPVLPGGPLPPAAQPPVAPAVSQPEVLPVAAAEALPPRPWLVLLATLLLALLAFAALMRPGSGAVAPGAAGERGVGRLRSPRSGHVPDLV